MTDSTVKFVLRVYDAVYVQLSEILNRKFLELWSFETKKLLHFIMTSILSIYRICVLLFFDQKRFWRKVFLRRNMTFEKKFDQSVVRHILVHKMISLSRLHQYASCWISFVIFILLIYEKSHDSSCVWIYFSRCLVTNALSLSCFLLSFRAELDFFADDFFRERWRWKMIHLRICYRQIAEERCIFVAL